MIDSTDSRWLKTPGSRYWLAVLGIAGLWVWSQPVLPDTWGLVIGINEYRYQQKPLLGAVNDAVDLRKALQSIGAREVVLLINAEANRAAIKAHWERLARQAQAGDTLVFTYAGHGGQEAEHVPGSEADGRDETLVLGGFRREKPGNGERLVDNEFNQWFTAAHHLNIIFVADACHSGTLTRQIDPRVLVLGTRLIDDYGPIKNDELPPPVVKSKPDGEEPPPHVTLLAAGRDDETISEIFIDRQPRGALSWAFARALEGRADADGNGVLDRAELRRYIVETVRGRTEFRQLPQIQPATDSPALLKTAGMKAPADAVPELTLSITGTAPDEAAKLLQQLRGVVPAAGDQPPDLRWDHAKNEVLSSHGDVVARLGSADPESVQNVIDKWRLLPALKRLSELNSLELRLQPNDHLHHRGEQVNFSLSGQRYSTITLFNLAADGTLQLLYPKPGDEQTLPVAKAYRFPTIQVVAPFGADHAVAIATPENRASFHEQLRRLHGQPSAVALAKLLGEITGRDYQLGIVGLYTAP